MKTLIIKLARNRMLQSLWARLHRLSLTGMNYFSGGPINLTGEEQFFRSVYKNYLLSQPHMRVFDVGANIGRYTAAVRKYFPNAEIYAFEPIPNNYLRLRETVAGDAAVQHFNFGLSDMKTEQTIFEAGPDGVLSSLYNAKADSNAIIARFETIDDFCSRYGISRISLLKIDVEGHELNVLRGGKEMVGSGNIDMIQFEMGENNVASRTYFYDFWNLLSNNYDIFRLLPNGLYKIETYSTLLEIFVCVNYLAIRKEIAKN